MKKLFTQILLATLCAAWSSAQITPTGAVQGIPNQGGILYASNFGQWQVPAGNLGQYSWRQSSYCYVGIPTGEPVITMPAFTAGTPVEIVDLDTPAHTEIVTPTAVSMTAGCSITINPTYGHNRYYLTSGTAGLQEALNWAGTAAYVVEITPDWTLLGGTSAMITAATAGASATILDLRSSTPVSYSGTTPAIVATKTFGVQNVSAGVLTITGSASAPGSIVINGSGAAPGAITLQPNTGGTALSMANAAGSMNLLLGTDNSGDGRLYTSNSAAAAHTIWGSAATTTNIILGFATAPVTGDLVSCTTLSTTCTLTDSGVLASNVTTAGGTLTSTALVTGGGTKALQTPSATATLSAAGALALPATGSITAPLFISNTNCAVNSVDPAACGAAPAGAFVVPTSTTTYTVNTTAVTAKSRIVVQPLTFAADLPSTPTCVAPSILSAWSVSAITAGTSFTIALPSTTGTTCWYYIIEN